MRNGRVVARTLLGSDDDDAVRSARTVDRGSRSILQHRERLDIARVDRRERIGHARDGVVRDGQTVDDDQRVVGRFERRAAADTYGRGRTRGTVARGNYHTGALAAQQVGRRGR